MISYSDTRVDTKFGGVLVDKNILSHAKLQEALERSKRSGRTLIEVLCEDFELDETLLYQTLSAQLGLAFADLKDIQVDAQVIAKVPVKIASYYHFMPLGFKDSKLIVAVDSALNIKTQDEIRLQLGVELSQVLSRKRDITECLKKHYGLAADTVERIFSSTKVAEDGPSTEISSLTSADSLAEDKSVVGLVNEVILEGFRKRATDIHLEPYRGQFRLRYRIDGVLRDANLSPKAKHLILPIISRIKIMSNLDIVEHRLPQDGRAIVKIHDQALDLRISSIPTPFGESIVIRVLMTQMIFDLKKLGLDEQNITLLLNLIQKPHGIILLTGPTGSGKTTTLYACLSRIDSKTKKIITLEDPIEYEIPGITQIQILPKVGLDFAKGLRSMLRHDPDVMMVGEIRDFETAEIAMRAALTGHLVFSTLHTNDAASGVARLLDIGVEPFLVASSLEAIIAQRLVRTLCVHCKEEDRSQLLSLKEKIAGDLKLKSAGEVKIYRGKGCEECSHTGFYGRTALHEILVVSEATRGLISTKARGQEIKRQAVSEGLTPLLVDGWKKVILGLTTPGEVMNVVNLEQESINGPKPDRKVPDSYYNRAEEDKRLYKRVPAEIEVAYRRVTYQIADGKRTISKSGEYDHAAVSRNVSASGLLLQTSESLDLRSIIDLKFKLSEDPKRLIYCSARVVRLTESPDNDGTEVGVMFLDLSSSDRVYISNFVSGVSDDG